LFKRLPPQSCVETGITKNSSNIRGVITQNRPGAKLSSGVDTALILISIIYKWWCGTLGFVNKRFIHFKWIDKPYKSLGSVRIVAGTTGRTLNGKGPMHQATETVVNIRRSVERSKVGRSQELRQRLMRAKINDCGQFIETLRLIRIDFKTPLIGPEFFDRHYFLPCREKT
jgi:hypothetical protein